MGQQGPPGAKKNTFFTNDPAPCGLPKQVFLARFELVLGYLNRPKCLENGLFWDQKWVKNGSQMCFSENGHGPFEVPNQVK